MKHRLASAAFIALGIVIGLFISQMFWVEVFARPGLNAACRAIDSTKGDAELLANCLNNSTRWATWLGVAINIVTAALVYNGFRQSEYTQRMEYRAYLRLDIREVGYDAKRGMIVILYITNYGRTPAQIVEAYLLTPPNVSQTNGETMKHLVKIDNIPGGGGERREVIEADIAMESGGANDYNEGANFIVTIVYIYKDVFGQIETLTERAHLNCRRNLQAGNLSVNKVT